MKDNAMAEFFYDQCVGSTNGHMAHIPNNPVLFSLISAMTRSSGATKPQFVEILRKFADELDDQ